MKAYSSVDKRKVFQFLAITFGISWAVGGTLYLLRIESGSIPFVLLVALFYMTAPGVATFVACGGTHKGYLQAYGLVWKGLKGQAVFFSIAFYFSFLALTFLLIFFIRQRLGIRRFW